MEPTVEPTAEPTAEPVVTGELLCGLEEHVHSDACYEDGEETCGLFNHIHSDDCYYVCGEIAHSHSENYDGGEPMTLGYDEHVHENGCYDAEGNLVCEHEVHTHTAVCLVAMPRAATTGRADFSEYIAKDKNDQAHGVTVKPNTEVVYDPVTGDFSTTLQLNFAIPNYVLKGYGGGWVWSWWGWVWDPGAKPVTSFYYELPDTIQILPDMLDMPFSIKSAGGTTEGTFRIVEEDGKYILLIDFDEKYLKSISAGNSKPGTPVKNTPYSQGSLYFECIIDSSAVADDGHIREDFTWDDELDIAPGKIKYPEGETAKHQLSTEKSAQYVVEGNKVKYTVKVSSTKGTPDKIDLKDILTLDSGVTVKNYGAPTVTKYTEVANGWGGWDKVGGSESSLTVKKGGPAEAKGTTASYEDRKDNGEQKIFLPQITAPADGTRTTYEVTYEIELGDFNEMEFQKNIGNSITAKTEKPGGDKIEVKASASVSISKTMLNKGGSYDKNTGLIKWTVTLNDGRQNIAGGKLTDTQFGNIADPSTIVVKKNNGETAVAGVDYKVVTDADGKVTAIEFPANNNDQNTDKYVIEYYTKPTKDVIGGYNEENKATFEDDGKKVEKGASAYVEQSYNQYKNSTGATADGTDLIISWKAGFSIFANGLSENLLITDTVKSSSNADHYMTLAQLKELYNSIKDQDWFRTGCDGKFFVKMPDGTLTNIEDLLANESQYADTKFGGFEFTIEAAKLPESYNGKTIEVNYKTTGDTSNLSSGNGSHFNNGWGVGPGTANGDHWYEPSKPVTKVDKMSGNWSNDKAYTWNSKTGELTWIVRINQTENCSVLKIVDQLPDKVELVKVELGMYTQSSITPDGNGGLTVNRGYHDEGLIFGGSYTGDTVTITVQKDPNAQWGAENRTEAFGAGKTLDLKFICKIKDEYMPKGNDDGSSKTIEYDGLLNRVNVYTDDTPYGDDTHEQFISVTSETRVTKNLISSNNKTGELKWKVEVYQEQEFNELLVTDKLPATYVGLKTVTVGAGSVLTYDSSVLPGTDGFVPMTLTSQAGGDMGLTITGKYNPTTNEVVVTVVKNDGATVNSDVWGEGKKFPLTYDCAIKDEYLPDTENDEYKVEFKNLINDVDVNADKVDYGSASTKNDFYVEYDRPKVEQGSKGHDWTPSLQTLHYTVDINPSAADMDPSKNMIDVTDVVSYWHNDGTYNRVLSLVKESVKLYYADYDAYGNPAKDASGRLIIGQEVPYSDWTMAYYENFVDDSWSTSTCTMELRVPDARALILEYDYFVDMTEVKGWDHPLNVSNKVTVRGTTSQEYSDSTSNNEQFKSYDAGGNISSEDSYTIVKVDALNHALVLPGAAFVVEEWNPETQEWDYALTYYTDALGVFTVMYDPNSDENEFDYEANRGYRIYESVAPYGYEKPSQTTYYNFYWSDDSADVINKSVWPDGFNMYATDLTGNAQNRMIENTKRATTMEVEKVWLDADGNPLAANDTPSSITVHLKRYAIPEDIWEENKDRYNGGLTETQEMVSVTLTDFSGNFQIAFERAVTSGALLKFDVVIADKNYGTSGSGFSPQFSNLPAGSSVSNEIVGNTEVFHYTVPIDGAVNITGKFQANQWWGWTGSLTPTVRFANVSVAFTGDMDDSLISAELDKYRDRNYNNTMTLTRSGDWTGMWDNLDVIGKDENGKNVHYKYFVVEESPSGFATTITGGSNDLSGSFTITNRKDNSKTINTHLRVIKEWYDENGLKTQPLEDAIEVRLYQIDNLTGREIVYPYNGFPTTVINGNTNWEFYFSNLPFQKTDVNGNLIQSYSYRIEEITKGDFTTELVISDDSGVMVLSDEPAIPQVIIKNTKKHPVDITVIKEWEEGEHGTDYIEVELTREKLTADGYVADTTFSLKDTDDQELQQKLHAGNGWTFTWLDLPDSGWLPKLDVSGNPIIDEETGEAVLESVSYRYLVKEISVNGKSPAESGYYPVYSNENGAVPNDGSMTITNCTPAQMEIVKNWVDMDGKTTDAPTEEVYVKLFRGDADVTSELTQKDNGVTPFGGYIKISEADGWKISIIGLDNATYSLKEYLVNQETGEYEEVTANLTITTEGTGSDADFTLTNKVEATELTVKKSWSLADGSTTPPANATASFKLMRKPSDGDAVEIDTFTLPYNGEWVYKIKDLPAKSDSGDVTYTYYVVEDAANGFTAVYSNSSDGKNFTPVKNNGLVTVVNRQEVTSLSVAKTWQERIKIEEVDEDGNVVVKYVDNTLTSPKDIQIEVELYRTSEKNSTPVKVGETIVLPTADGLWRATVSKLPKASADGSETYSYYFKEVSAGIDGFETIYNDDPDAEYAEPNEQGVASIINRAQTTEVQLKKNWYDTDGTTALTGDLLPQLVKVELYQRAKVPFTPTDKVTTDPNTDPGILYDSYELTAEKGWALKVTDLPKISVDGSGNLITYEYILREVSVPGFDTTNPTEWKQNADSTLTVVNTLKKLDVSVQKIWSEDTTTKKDVSITVKRYILNGTQKVIDPAFAQVLSFTVDNYAEVRKLENLPAYGIIPNGDKNLMGEFHYFAVETTELGEDYEVTYTINDSTFSKENGEEASITETGTLKVHNRQRTKLEVRKEWEGVPENYKTEIQLTLWRKELAAGTEAGEAPTTVRDTTGCVEIDTVFLNAENGWKAVLYDLPAISDAKLAYEYFFVEDTEGFDVTYTGNSSNGTGVITVTNKKIEAEKYSLEIVKSWVNLEAQDTATAPEGAYATFQLYRIYRDNNETVPVGEEFTLNAENGWQHTIPDLESWIEVEGEDGKPIQRDCLYYVEETDYSPASFGTIYSNLRTVENEAGEKIDTFMGVGNGTITVTNFQQATSISVEKLWTDSNGQKITPPKGAQVILTIYRNGQPTDITVKLPDEDGNWSADIANLPLQDHDGNPYKYHVQETSKTNADGFTAVYTQPGTSKDNAITEGTATVINTAPTTQLTINKTWWKYGGTEAYTETDLPDSIDLNLYYRTFYNTTETVDGVETTVKVTGEETLFPYSAEKAAFTVTKEKNWSLTIDKLPLKMTDADGVIREVEYILREVETEDSQFDPAQPEVIVPAVSGSTTAELKNNRKAKLTVNKEWFLNDNQFDMKEGEVDFTLYRTVLDTATASSDTSAASISLTAKSKSLTAQSRANEDGSVNVTVNFWNPDNEWNATYSTVLTTMPGESVQVKAQLWQAGSGNVPKVTYYTITKADGTTTTVTPELVDGVRWYTSQTDPDGSPTTTWIVDLGTVEGDTTLTFWAAGWWNGHEAGRDEYTVTLNGSTGGGTTTNPDYDDDAEEDEKVPGTSEGGDPGIGDKVEYNGEYKFTLSADNNWTYTFDDLPATNSQGKEYVYFVVEDAVDGYDSTYEGELDGPNGSLTIKNKKYVYKDTYLYVEKKWQNADGSAINDLSTVSPVKFKLWRIQTEREVEEDFGSLPTVNVTFIIKDKDGNTETSVTKTLVKGATYEWTPTVTAADNPAAAPKDMSVSYNGKAYTLSRTTNAGMLPVRYSMTFTAAANAVDENAVIINTDAAGLTGDTWKHSFTLTESPDAGTAVSSYGLRAISRASEVVDTTGATLVGTYDLNSGNSWKWSEKNLPKVSEDGKYDYFYLVEEVDVPFGYEVSYGNNIGVVPTTNGTTITVTNRKIDTQPFSLEVVKEWIDNEGNVMTSAPEGATVTIALMQVPTSGVEVQHATAELNASNSWKTTFTNLPSCSADGQVYYTYYVKETASTNANGFKVTYSNTDSDGNIIPMDKTTAPDGIKVTNKQKTTRLSILKQWQNSDGSNLVAPSGVTVQFQLYQKSGVNGTPVKYGSVETLNAENKWEWQSKVLPAIDPANGNDYYYWADEIKIEGSDADFAVTLPSNWATAGQLRITNKVKPTSIQIDKEWFGPTGAALDGDEAFLPDSISVYIEQRTVKEGQDPSDWTIYGYNTYTVKKADNWTLTVDNLPMFTTDSTGTRINYEYRVSEFYEDGYETTYENNDGVSNATNPIVIKNTMEPMSYQVTKVYNAPADVKKPEVEVKLIRQITENGKTLSEVVQTIKLPYKAEGTDAETWLYIWSDLPTIGTIGTDDDKVSGNYIYSAVEVEPVGFIASYTRSQTDTIITNTPTALDVTKQWLSLSSGAQTTIKDRTVYYQILQYKLDNDGKYVDADNDGSPDATVYENKTHEMSDTNGVWPTVTHYALPLYWTDEGSQVRKGEYRYSIVETDSTGAEIAAEFDKTLVDIATPGSITIKNTVTNIPVRKIWSAGHGVLPDELPDVTLILRRKTAQIGGVTDNDFEKRITLSAENYPAGTTIWSYTWYDLDSYGIVDGEVVQWLYYVEEAEVADGFQHLTGADLNNLGITGQYGSDQTISITNEVISYELPETGGAGTTPYTVCGLLLITAATALMYIELNRKKQWGEGNES